MGRYELCVNADTPGGGVRFETLEAAKLAGWREVGPAEADVASASLDDFFTVHEASAGDTAPVLVFDSRADDAGA
jgi:hypothetical protein